MLAASIAVCGFEHGVRQLSALGLTCRPQGHEAQRATVCAVRADGTLIAGVVRTCYAEMTVAQAELRSGRAPIVLGAFTFRRGWPCRVDGAAHRTAHRCAARPAPLVAEVIRTIAELGERRILLRALREGIDNRYTYRASPADENDRAEEKQVVHDMETLRAG